MSPISKINFEENNEQTIDEDKLDEILENITLKPPKNYFAIYSVEKYNEQKAKNKNFNENFVLFNRECTLKWAKMDDEEKAIYKQKAEEEKKRYQYEIEIIRHYLFKDYNENIRSPPTAYSLFVSERMMEGFEQNLDPTEVKKNAKIDWKKMSAEEKLVYTQKKKENDNFFEKAKNIKKVNGVSMFFQKVIEMAKIKNETIPTLIEVTSSWKVLPSNIKKKFEKYAESINEEREKLRDIYEIVNGIKPKSPCGAYKIFLQEQFKNKNIKNTEEAKELWNELNDDEKEKYLKKAHRIQLAYKYKKMIYDKKIKRFIPKKPNIYCVFRRENHRKIFDSVREEYNDLSKQEKKKYEKIFKEEMEKYNEKMEKFKNYVFDMPKAPQSAFTLFMKQHLKSPEKNLSDEKIRNDILKEWRENDELREEYEKKFALNKKIFKKQMNDFHKLGYYFKNNDKYFESDEESDSNSDEEENTTKKEKKAKRTNKKESISANKKKKKTLEKEKERSRAKDRSRNGKTQKKKK